MEIVGVYEDAGKSGKSIEGRPAFKKMLSDIKTGLEIDYILVYKLSRFGRNAADILNSLEFVQSYGINLICIEEGIDSSQTSGKLLISVLSAVAEIERENIIEQTMKEFWEIDRQNIPTLDQVRYASIHIYNGAPQPLCDGMVFDLGGVRVQMIHAQGHTPGMMCALVPEERTMFFGDACGMSVLLHDEFSSTASEYLRSLKRLKEYEDQYDTVYRNHGSFTNEKSLLDNVIECAELIVAGRDDHVPVEIFHKTLYQAK